MYDKDLPKPKVEVNITILDILDVDIKKSTFDIYYVQEVFWYDYDLSELPAAAIPPSGLQAQWRRFFSKL